MAEDESERELFDHLVAEFGDRGQDAVQFLTTAQRLVAQDPAGELPRAAAAAAYCIREALQRLLPPESGQPGWRKLSNEVLDAKRRLEAIRGLPGTDEAGALEQLLTAIGQLQEFKEREQGQHQRRLAGVMEARTGAPPLEVPLREYQRLLGEINRSAVHGSASPEQVRELLGRALSLLRMAFAPFQLRQPQLDALAQLPDPSDEDVQRLRSLCSTLHHLSYFMQHAVTPQWLWLLTPEGVLDPPASGGIWPARFAVERLAATHPQEVAAWLEDMYATWGKTETGAAYLALVARDCLPAAAPTLLRALRDYPRTHWVRAQAAGALKVMDASSRFIEATADVLLDPGDEVALTGTAQRTTQALCDGMTLDNADARVDLMARKLASSAEARYPWFLAMPFGFVEDLMDESERGTSALLKGVMAVVRRAGEIGVPTERLLAFLEPVPSGLRCRLRAWALHEATDISPDAVVNEFAYAIRSRDPTGDDLRLIQRITNEMQGELYVESWRDAMGPAPPAEEIGRALASQKVPHEWQRARRWHPLLPDAVCEAWDTPVTLMSPVLPAPTRQEYLEALPEPQFGWARSPMTKAELERLDVRDAARRISSWRPTGDYLVIARELARTLEELVASEPRAWAIRPLEILALLQHATYIHHYFEGLTKTPEDLSGLGPALVRAVVFARTHPWELVQLGGDDFDYDPTWAPTDEAGVSLIGRLAERDVALEDSYDDAWRVVLAAARDRSSGSRIISPREDPLETAINRPCTKALAAMLQLVAAELRRGRRVRTEALDLLDETLGLGGWDGAEHRAIIAPRLPFLRHVAPEWVESREPRLFGDQAPEDLGQKTVELALQWGRPDRWLLERHRRAIFRALRSGSKHALDHMLVAMLWELPGYSTEATWRALASMGASVLSDAGERLARLLMHDPAQEHLDRGVLFWDKALQDQSLPGGTFWGFGWWAEVEALDRARWEQMTLTTCERAEGSLDWCAKVAERCAREPITTTGLGILTKLLRGRHEPWDRSQVAEVALGALKASSSDPTLSEARERLRATLTDLGYFGAADI
jgi:hypothetical protein